MSEKQKRLSDYDQGSGQLGVTEMIGAIIFMVIGGLRKNYKHYYQVKYQKRNIWVGYIGSIMIIFFSILIIIYFFPSV